MSSFKNPPRRLADLVRPHKPIVPSPEPIVVAPKRPNFIKEGWSWHPEDQITRPPMPPFDPTKMRLHRSPRQKGDRGIIGTDLRVELEGMPVLGSDDLDRLLAEPRLIPDSWKGKYIYFWGDLYRRSAGNLCVRDLYWDGGRWVWNDYWLGGDWNSRSPAAVVAS